MVWGNKVLLFESFFKCVFLFYIRSNSLDFVYNEIVNGWWVVDVGGRNNEDRLKWMGFFVYCV